MMKSVLKLSVLGVIAFSIFTLFNHVKNFSINNEQKTAKFVHKKQYEKVNTVNNKIYNSEEFIEQAHAVSRTEYDEDKETEKNEAIEYLDNVNDRLSEDCSKDNVENYEECMDSNSHLVESAIDVIHNRVDPKWSLNNTLEFNSDNFKRGAIMALPNVVEELEESNYYSNDLQQNDFANDPNSNIDSPAFNL